MKQPPFATSLKLFKLCKLLALAVVFKLVVITTLAVDTGGWYIPFLGETTIVSSTTAPAEPTLPATVQQAAAPAPGALLAVSGAHAAPPDGQQPADPAQQAPVQQGNGFPQDALTRESLQQKQEELNRREADLNRLQQEINQKIQNLQQLEQRLQVMLEQAEETKDKKMRHLVDVYSNMKAKQAADVLSTLDEGIAVKILAGMRGRQAGEILTFVNAEKAARLSEALTRMQLPFE
ncbi:MotE family protein [Desulfovibrio psychrotolerans]|uniref:Magnesium transporter MgtE intracellular domain-containing protein n=1 Tax=Desulfovibrio psychrotolerans TaxID=415242 RepID=A0A7J0BTV6_9BACT|nr:hypothetical protein [Desulfovibrio psychrotolerans]GFM37098.1 hypothetical protein DSM19430T_17820 [Desulfovibrio psychrotolerans]